MTKKHNMKHLQITTTCHLEEGTCEPCCTFKQHVLLTPNAQVSVDNTLHTNKHLHTSHI